METFVPQNPVNSAGGSTEAVRVSTGNYRYAGFWIRLVAAVLDGVVLAVFSSLVLGSAVTSIDATGGVSVSFTGWYNLIPLIYTIGFWIWIGATPGKFICRIKIIAADGTKVKPLQAVLRYFAYIISAIPFGIGFIWAGFDSKKQAWHDKLVKTLVIKR